MKHHTFLKRALAVGLSALLLTSGITPALAYDLYEDAPIKELTLNNDKGREITFVDLYGGQTIGRPDTSDEILFYRDALTRNGVLQDWATLGYLIHKNVGESYSDYAGDGWDTDFGKGHYMDYIYDMQNASSVHDWDGSNYCKVSTGLSVASSLKEVQERATNEIADEVARDMGGDSYLKRHAMAPLTDEEQDVLYSTITTVDQHGTTQRFTYNSFTIAFYDFKLHPLDDGSALAGEVSYHPGSADTGVISLNTNSSRNDAEASLNLANSETQTYSTSVTNSEQYSFGQSIGLDLAFAGKSAAMHFEGGFTIKGNLSYEQVLGTAYSESNQVSTTENKDVTVGMIVPAHTAATAIQTSGTTVQTMKYDCPVGLSYRVAIFSMCGDVYDDGLATQDFATYEQTSFLTIFGLDKDASDGVENLYQRAINHKGDTSYDDSYGETAGTDYQSGDTWCTYLDWEDIAGSAAASSKAGEVKSARDVIDHLSKTYPMSITGATTSIQQDSVSTEIDQPMPLYPIASTYIDWQLDRSFELTVGDSRNITSYRVKAADKDGVPYYGFIATQGEWRVVDENGEEKASEAIEIVNDSVTGEQTIRAKAPGTGYVKYFIPENTYYTWDDVVSTNANISSPAYKVIVSAEPEEEAAPFEGTIEVTGSVEATVGEAFNLNGDSLTVTVCDPTGKEVDAEVFWEARELASKGITVTSDGAVTTTQAGTFHVRAYIDAVYSDWVEVVITEPQDLILYTCYHPFDDVPHGAWYEPAVEFTYQNGILAGTGETSFHPNGKVTRAQIAQTLYNLANQPFVVSENPFEDVKDNAWYAPAVLWAAETGVTTGVKADRFDPNAPVTREQLAAFVCRYADWAGLTLSADAGRLENLADLPAVSGWAKESVEKAVQAGILAGGKGGLLDPQGTATRAQLAQVFLNFLAED